MDSRVDFEAAAREMAEASAPLAEPTDAMVQSAERRLAASSWSQPRKAENLSHESAKRLYNRHLARLHEIFGVPPIG